MLALGPTQDSVPSEPGDFRGVKWPGHGVNHPPHVAPKLKKQLGCTSSLPTGLRGLLLGDLYLYHFYFKYLKGDEMKFNVRVPCLLSIFLLIYFQQDATLHSSFISGKLLYMFRTVSPPIIRGNCIYSVWYLLTVTFTSLYCRWVGAGDQLQLTDNRGR